jgi:hypothetical protein
MLLLSLKNFKIFDNKQIYKNRMQIATIIYSLVYIFFFVYLKYNSVIIFNPLFIILAGFSMVPIAPFLVHSIVYLKKVMYSKANFSYKK